MDILSVINPCTEVYTIFSQRRYLLGVFGEMEKIEYSLKFETNKIVLVSKGLA